MLAWWSHAAVVAAYHRLARLLQAIDEERGDKLTPLGYHLASLPVDPRIGKMLLFGAVFQCLDPILTIAASMSFRSPFLAPIDKRDEAEMAKQRFLKLDSDHLTIMHVRPRASVVVPCRISRRVRRCASVRVCASVCVSP